MAERQYAKVRPELLRWARESAGLGLQLAAKRIGTSPERLAKWEEGQLNPTVRQLRECARVYRRPLAAFFLPTPPEEPALPHDFRRLPGHEAPVTSPELLLELRRARRRRAVARELLEDLGLKVPAFPLRAGLNDDAEVLAAEARNWLGVALEEQASWRGKYDSLNGWIAALEARNVLVFQTGEVEPEEMRGFSVSDTELPAIVLNGKDAPRARVFTLMHELTHLMLRESGLCEPARVSNHPRTPDERVEWFCNRVAGSVLVPADSLLRHPAVVRTREPQAWDDGIVQSLADQFAVSREVVLRRLLVLGRTTEQHYLAKREQFRAEYVAQLARERERAPEGFAPPSTMAVRDNGKQYTRLVLEALEREKISYADVTDYLGVRLKHLDAIADALREAEAGA